MQSGNLRKRITIQQRSTSIEPTFGQQVLAWSDLFTAWCEIEAISGQQVAHSQSIYNATTHHITLRYRIALANVKQVGSYRAVYVSGGVTRYFDIGASLNELERNRSIVLYASEGLNDGQ